MSAVGVKFLEVAICAFCFPNALLQKNRETTPRQSANFALPADLSWLLKEVNTYSKNIKYHEGFPDTPKIRAAITDLVELIIDHYPEATFDVTASPEDTQVVHLCTTVDRIDTDELVDLVIDREMAGF